MSPLHAEAAETRAEAREAAARAEVAKARTEAAKTAARAEEAAIRAEGAMARTETVVRQAMAAEPLLSPKDGKRIRDRDASFADELRERENDALRLSTPRRLIDERKSATDLRALGVSAKDEAHDVSECKKENTASRALL